MYNMSTGSCQTNATKSGQNSTTLSDNIKTTNENEMQYEQCIVMLNKMTFIHSIILTQLYQHNTPPPVAQNDM